MAANQQWLAWLINGGEWACGWLNGSCGAQPGEAIWLMASKAFNGIADQCCGRAESEGKTISRDSVTAWCNILAKS